MDERIRKMKTYKHLFEKLVAEDNVHLAIHNASLGKHDRPVVQEICNNEDIHIPRLQALCENYKNHNHTPKEIYDGISRKKRIILVPAHDEQVVHHMIVNVLKPIFMKSLYEHSYGSIPGRGSHLAKKHIEKWIKRDPKNTKYCLQMDVRKYFDSVPHDILKAKLSKIIKDKKFLDLLFTIIDVQPIGIPLGFYTSQWLANFYLTELDHYIKEQLCATYFVRYMDDMVIFGANKRTLHKLQKLISNYLETQLGLKMKSTWQVFKIEYEDKQGKTHGRPLDFMGFKFYRNRTTLRRKIMLRASRKARKIAKKIIITIYDCRQMLAYAGWIAVTNVHSFYVLWIKPYVNLSLLRRQISIYDRRVNKLCGMKLSIA